MYSLLSFRVPVNNFISSSKNLAISSPVASHPLFKFGFHNYIVRTREALSTIIKKLESKKKFYNIVNNFELEIQDYTDSIQNLTQLYFNIKKNINYSDNFYKLWEILNIFNIITNEKINILIIESTVSNYDDSINKYIEKILNKDSSQYVITTNNNKSKNNMDLIITNYENTEQTNYLILLENLLKVLNSQKKNGNLIFKVFDTFTIINIKIIYILSSLYDQVYIYKPLISRASESEKFVICKNFKFENTKNLINDIEKIIEMSNDNKYVNDIFCELILPNDFVNSIKFINVKLVNIEQIQINEIIKYIKENNYFGDKYHTFKNNQIEATKWLLNMFFPPSANIAKNSKETLEKLFISSVEKNNLEKEKFINL